MSAEKVLDLVLSNDRSTSSHGPLRAGLPQQSILRWVGLTPAVWLVILELISTGFLHQLERQELHRAAFDAGVNLNRLLANPAVG